MKCIIYQQSTCRFNVILRNNVKYYVILPTLFHTPFHMASKKCLAIVYLFEENRPNWLFAKVFIKKSTISIQAFINTLTCKKCNKTVVK